MGGARKEKERYPWEIDGDEGIVFFEGEKGKLVKEMLWYGVIAVRLAWEVIERWPWTIWLIAPMYVLLLAAAMIWGGNHKIRKMIKRAFFFGLFILLGAGFWSMAQSEIDPFAVYATVGIFTLAVVCGVIAGLVMRYRRAKRARKEEGGKATGDHT